jgi:hypothetical protein
MAWFPAPTHPTAAVVEALQAEKEYLLGPWLPFASFWWKWALATVVPVTFAALGRAFWVRSWGWGLLVWHGMAVIKTAWTWIFFPSPEARLLHLKALLIGFGGCDLIFFFVMWVGWNKDNQSTKSIASNRKKKKKK